MNLKSRCATFTRTRGEFAVAVRWFLFVSIVTCTAFVRDVPAAEQSAAEAGESRAEYVFGVFPFLPARELEKVFAPIAAHFSRALGQRVVFASSSSYEVFANKLNTQAFDIGFMQPFDYIRVADRYGYIPLATRSEQLKALLVTTQDSPVMKVADLKGKRISLPPTDAAVSHLIRAYLRRNGLTPGKDVDLVYFRSHVSCMQQVLINAVAACGTAAPALRYFKSRMSVDMRTIAETDPIPHTLFAVHPRVPEAQRKLLLDVILSWSKTPEGKELLARGKMTSFIPVTNDAYNVVRKFPGD